MVASTTQSTEDRSRVATPGERAGAGASPGTVQLKKALVGQPYAAQAALLSPSQDGGGDAQVVQMHGNVRPDNQGGLKDRVERTQGGLADEIERLMDESTVTDDELMAIVQKLAQLGGPATFALVSGLSPKAREELVDNLNPPHLAHRQIVLEILNGAGKEMVQEWIDLDVIHEMAVDGISGREAMLLNRLLGLLKSDQLESVLEGKNGPALKKAKQNAKAYGRPEAEADAAANLQQEFWPAVKADLQKSQQGKDALAILESSKVPLQWKAGAEAGVLWSGPGQMQSVVIGAGQTPHMAAQSLIHECYHINMMKSGQTAMADKVDRQTYIDRLLEEEADGTILAAQATLARGGVTGIAGEDIYITYYNGALHKGADPAKAHEEGRKELIKALRTGKWAMGGIVAGASGKPYAQHYGDEWDEAHGIKKAGGD